MQEKCAQDQMNDDPTEPGNFAGYKNKKTKGGTRVGGDMLGGTRASNMLGKDFTVGMAGGMGVGGKGEFGFGAGGDLNHASRLGE